MDSQADELGRVREERVRLETCEAELAATVASLSEENSRLSTENDRLAAELRAMRSAEGVSDGAGPAIRQPSPRFGEALGQELTLGAAEDSATATPSHRSSRLRSSLAQAERVLSLVASPSSAREETSRASDSVDALALRSRQLQQENAQMRRRLAQYEERRVVPHDVLLRMARYLNEKEEELFAAVETVQSHNTRIEGLRTYADRLSAEYLGDGGGGPKEAASPSALQVKQVLRNLVRAISAVQPMDCGAVDFRVSTASELLRRFTSHCSPRHPGGPSREQSFSK